MIKIEITFVICVMFDIITIAEQARNQEFFRAGEVSWNKSTLINNPSTTHERKVPQEIILGFFLLDTHKSPF